MRKRIWQVVGVLMCLIIVCVWGMTHRNDKVQIEDEKTPLGTEGMVLLSRQECDTTVIPDRYNTGTTGELTVVTSDCYISGVKFGTSGKADRKLDLYYQKNEVPDTIVVENYDFSASNFREYNVAKVNKKVNILYKNCKFRSYIISGEGLVERKFENCSFTHFGGSNAEFVNCYFGGGADGDGINPMRNCTFTNCMIADLIQPAEKTGTKHIDGFQIFGSTDGTDNENIVLNNCRFEVPYIPLSTPSGALNCPVSVIMRYSDANQIEFRNCYVNGGLYYGMMLLDNDCSVTNLSISNLHIGGSSKSLYTCDSAFESIMKEQVLATDSLYVSSVRKMEDGIHLSVTNDTIVERTLSILTDQGVQEIVIPACFVGSTLQKDSVTYEDYPFDLDVVIEDAQWVACFDTTMEAKQIRFVNWTQEDVYADLSAIYSKNHAVNDSSEVFKEDIVAGTEEEKKLIDEETKLEGMCGDKVSFVLENGILTISGEGNTYDYHSGNMAPWHEKKDEITVVKVEEGVLKLGNQLFSECSNLTTVTLPEGLTEIGSNVFKKCKSLQNIQVPKTLQKVGKRSFTSSVGNVEYGGTQTEWEMIQFDEFNDAIFQAEIRYKNMEDAE